MRTAANSSGNRGRECAAARERALSKKTKEICIILALAVRQLPVETENPLKNHTRHALDPDGESEEILEELRVLFFPPEDLPSWQARSACVRSGKKERPVKLHDKEGKTHP